MKPPTFGDTPDAEEAFQNAMRECPPRPDDAEFAIAVLAAALASNPEALSKWDKVAQEALRGLDALVILRCVSKHQDAIERDEAGAIRRALVHFFRELADSTNDRQRRVPAARAAMIAAVAGAVTE
jgi:hypothetical protein